MIKIIAFALISLFLIVFLKNIKPEYGVIATAAAGGILLLWGVGEVAVPLEDFLKELENYGVESGLITYLLKTLGICYITRFAAELCADFGLNSLSAKVDFVGRGAIFLLSIPIIRSILNVGLSIIE